MFQKPTFIAVLIIPIGVGFGFITLLAYIPLYFQTVLNYSPFAAGLVLLPLAIPSVLVPPLSGRLVHHIPARILLSTGLILIGLGLLWMRAIAAHLDWTSVLGGLILTGAGVGIINGLIDNVAISVAPPERSGMAAGILGTMRLSGEATAVAMAGSILVSLTRTQLFTTITDVPAMEGQQDTLVSLVVSGNINLAAASIPAEGREAFIHAATQSYTHSFAAVLMILASITLACAFLTLYLVQSRDFDSGVR